MAVVEIETFGDHGDFGLSTELDELLFHRVIVDVIAGERTDRWVLDLNGRSTSKHLFVNDELEVDLRRAAQAGMGYDDDDDPWDWTFDDG